MSWIKDLERSLQEQNAHEEAEQKARAERKAKDLEKRNRVYKEVLAGISPIIEEFRSHLVEAGYGVDVSPGSYCRGSAFHVTRNDKDKKYEYYTFENARNLNATGHYVTRSGPAFLEPEPCLEHIESAPDGQQILAACLHLKVRYFPECQVPEFANQGFGVVLVPDVKAGLHVFSRILNQDGEYKVFAHHIAWEWDSGDSIKKFNNALISALISVAKQNLEVFLPKKDRLKQLIQEHEAKAAAVALNEVPHQSQQTKKPKRPWSRLRK